MSSLEMKLLQMLKLLDMACTIQFAMEWQQLGSHGVILGADHPQAPKGHARRSLLLACRLHLCHGNSLLQSTNDVGINFRWSPLLMHPKTENKLLKSSSSPQHQRALHHCPGCACTGSLLGLQLHNWSQDYHQLQWWHHTCHSLHWGLHYWECHQAHTHYWAWHNPVCSQPYVWMQWNGQCVTWRPIESCGKVLWSWNQRGMDGDDYSKDEYVSASSVQWVHEQWQAPW